MTCSAPCRIGMFFFLSGCKICLFFCFASTQDSTVRRSKNLRLQVIINRFVVFCYFEAIWGPSRSRSDNYLIIWRRVISGPNVDLENQFPNLVIPKLFQPFSSHEFFFRNMCLHYSSSIHHQESISTLNPASVGGVVLECYHVKGLSTRSNRANVNIVSNLGIYLTIITYTSSRNKHGKLLSQKSSSLRSFTLSINFAHYSENPSLPIHAVRGNLFLNDTKYRSVYVPYVS